MGNLLLGFPLSGWTQTSFPPLGYLSLIQQKIGENIIYPSEAKLKGWEGVVVVRFTLGQNGLVKELSIAKSSGYPLLDEAAISAVKNASPYPSLKYPTGTEELVITLPINYERAEKQTKTDLDLESPVHKEPKELEGFVKLALKNNEPTRIAREEIELSQLKINEAQRGLFPALKLESYRAKGKTESLFEYEEREVKLKADHPLYYGGRLKSTLNRAKVNLEITQKNYERLKIDVNHKTEVAYYNLVASQMNLETQQILRQEAERLLKIVKKQANADLITGLELAGAQSWYEQIDFQINSIKHDMALAELTFTQVLNISEAPPISRQELKIQELELNLNGCLQQGLKHRPEVILSKLLVRFNQYSKKIEESKERFTVDLTTSYGYYQGRFKTEPMRSSNSWYVGFKATKPWGGSTLTNSVTTDETGQRFGETSRTSSFTLRSDFAFLDNLARLSDDKKADVELKRALSDLNETKKTVNFEIKDAFLNYQKALLQANTAQTETAFRRQEVEVLKVRSQVGETSLSNVLEALLNYSRSQTNYSQALGNYYISLANLKKATGYGIQVEL